MERCIKKITDWLIRCDAVQEADRELYDYALYSIFLTLSPLLLAICFGVMFGAVWQSILIILPFVTIRKFSGGYHAKRASKCFISSSLLLVLCIALSFCINCNIMLMGFTVLSAVSLVHFSPLESENRLLSREEQLSYKNITAGIVTSYIFVDLLFVCFHLYECVICVSIGLILAAGLQIPCILKALSQKKIDQKR